MKMCFTILNINIETKDAKAAQSFHILELKLNLELC